jgi:hypothetical protein
MIRLLVIARCRDGELLSTDARHVPPPPGMSGRKRATIAAENSALALMVPKRRHFADEPDLGD